MNDLPARLEAATEGSDIAGEPTDTMRIVIVDLSNDRAHTIQAIQGLGHEVVVLGSVAGTLGRAMVMALSMPSFADIPLVKLPRKHKPTRAEWRRQMKGAR
jgi:hypothetical protein